MGDAAVGELIPYGARSGRVIVERRHRRGLGPGDGRQSRTSSPARAVPRQEWRPVVRRTDRKPVRASRRARARQDAPRRRAGHSSRQPTVESDLRSGPVRAHGSVCSHQVGDGSCRIQRRLRHGQDGTLGQPAREPRSPGYTGWQAAGSSTRSVVPGTRSSPRAPRPSACSAAYARCPRGEDASGEVGERVEVADPLELSARQHGREMDRSALRRQPRP